MKIAFVLDDGLNKPDGVQQYILTLGRWYASNGHEVFYLVGETDRPDITNVHSMAKNMKVKFNGNSLTIPLPASGKRIKRLLSKEQFDVIHVQVPYSPFMGAKVVKYSDPKTRVIGTFHILPYGWMSRFGTKLLGIWLHRNLKRFDKMLSVSQPAADFAKTSFKVDSTVVPNAVDFKRYKPLSPKINSSSPLRILFLGRLVHRKGCQQLIKALIILQNRDYKVDICGDGPLRNQLEKMVKDNNLQQVITFHGFISEAQKINFMQNADISIFPSLSGESFGIVLIEAMAAGGGIVLGGDNPGYRSVLQTTPGAIIDVTDPQIMARQISTHIGDAEKRQILYAAQQKLVHQFDVDKVAKQVLEFYKA